MNQPRFLSSLLSGGTLAILLSSATVATGQEGETTARATAAEMEAQLLSSTRQLTFEGRRAGEGYFSHDGTRLVFQSEREKGNPFYQIYLLDLETGDTERISPGFGKTTCAWIHPDDNRVLYASTHLDPKSVQLQNEEIEMRNSGQQRRYAWDYDDHFDIFAHDLKTGKDTRLTLTNGYDAEGSYSPDGNWIAYSSNRHVFHEPMTDRDMELFEIDKSVFLDIYLMKADGTDVVRLTTKRGYDGGPFFSPDGKKICWRRFSEDGVTAEIFTMDLDGSNKRQLTNIQAMSWAPYFHPSQEYLIFTTNRHGFANFELYIVDVRGEREPVRVTYTNGFDGLPVFSPKGDMLAWTTNRTAEKQSQIFFAQWDHEKALRMLRSSPERGSEAVVDAQPTVETTDYTEVVTQPAIRAEDLKKHVYTLASPKMQGRMTGTVGEKIATEYVAEEMERIGLQPAGNGGWFQSWESTVVRGRGRDGGEEKTFRGRNVLGLLQTSDRDDAPVIVLGAHVDHLGLDGADSSRATPEDRNQLHAGADDNASGVAAMLEVAEYLMDLRKRGKFDGQFHILFAAWSGEEMGLLGSKHFAESLKNQLGDAELRSAVAACLNMDMVGRLDDALILSGIGSSSIWRKEIEKRNAPVGLSLSLVDDCNLPTDTSSFYPLGVPILSAFTGAHDDYHTPRDTADKLDYDGMQRVTRFMSLLTRGLAQRDEAPDYVLHESEAPRTSRTGAKAYLGSIPDYAKAEIPGLRLSGVATGGPAHKAGVRGGDVVVSLNGHEIKDIYDYTDALDALKPGKEVEITIVRDGERKQFRLVPGSRE